MSSHAICEWPGCRRNAVYSLRVVSDAGKIEMQATCKQHLDVSLETWVGFMLDNVPVKHVVVQEYIGWN